MSKFEKQIAKQMRQMIDAKILDKFPDIPQHSKTALRVAIVADLLDDLSENAVDSAFSRMVSRSNIHEKYIAINLPKMGDTK